MEREALDDIGTLRGSRIRELDDAGRSFNHMVEGLRERHLIRETLGRFVPEEIAGTLLMKGGRLEPIEAEATILFCDLVSFTSLTEKLGPNRTVEMLNAFSPSWLKSSSVMTGSSPSSRATPFSQLSTLRSPIGNMPSMPLTQRWKWPRR